MEIQLTFNNGDLMNFSIVSIEIEFLESQIRKYTNKITKIDAV